MKLKELHGKFSRDATYRKAYAGFGDMVALAAHCRAIREEEGIRQGDLATILGVSKFHLSRFENLGPAPDAVVAAVVAHFAIQLRRRGADIGGWLSIHRPTTPARDPGIRAARGDRPSVALPIIMGRAVPPDRVSGKAAKGA